MATVSVIVRVRDRARTIESALRSVRAQTVPAEVVVVDSGSRDGTLDIARRHADRLIEIPPGSFTYGGALNAGADAASGAIHVALSAHCALPTEGWLERVLEHHADPSVAGTAGAVAGPDGAALAGPLRQAGDPARDPNPYWGYSNHAGSWRADVWQRHPFEEHWPACEDKAWAAAVRRDGLAIVMDPALFVSAGHRRREGVRALFRRAQREAAAIVRISGKRPLTPREAAALWWSGVEHGRPAWLQRASPFRAAEIAGRLSGERAARD